MTIRTIWLREFYDPIQPAPEIPECAQEMERHKKDELLVLTAMEAGKMTCPQISMHYGRDRHAILRAINRLVKAGQVIAIGQGGARRYLLNAVVSGAVGIQSTES